MNDRQRRFCEFYAANPSATQAAIAAGYSPKTARQQGARLLTNVNIITFLSELTEAAFEKNCATLIEIRSFWSDVFRDESQKTADRLRASELLVRSAGAFCAAIEPQNDNSADADVVVYIPKMLPEKDCQIRVREAKEEHETVIL